MSFRRWQIAKSDKVLSRSVAQRFGIDGFAAHLLTSRGFCSDEQISDMLGLDDDTAEFIDPFDIIDMDKAVSRIRRAIDRFERIAVYGDYDVDGVTSTALLFSYLESVGANVMYYIPDREGEGYGLNCQAVDSLHEMNIDLIVTVDNGISAVNEVAYAGSLGIDVVITDHHQEGDDLPAAVAVVDPHRKDSLCRFKEYAGVGVAFKLVCALEGDSMAVMENCGDLVALGTVADVVSLTGENRRLVRLGLRQLQSSCRPGLSALIDMAGLSGKTITSTSIAFVIAPRLNAAGRLGKASHAVMLLITEDDEEASYLAEELTAQNKERQAIEQIIDREVTEMLAKDSSVLYDRVIVIAGENWNGGVVGIFASRICERYGKPCFIISYEGDRAKGSGRSIEGFSLYEAISACADTLTGFGGHTLAAGINLKTENIDPFRRAINDYAREKYPVMPSPVLNIDCQLPPSAVTLQLCDASQLLEPFGADNSTPVIAVMGLKISDIYGAGGGKHQRLTMERNGAVITAMKFSTADEDFPFKVGDTVDIAVTLDKSIYRGRESLTVIVRDIRLSETHFDEIKGGRQLFEKMLRGEPLSDEETDQLKPTRAMLGIVYRAVSGGYRGEADVLGCRLKRMGVGFAAMLTSMRILSEGGLLRMSDEGSVISVEAVERRQGNKISPEETPSAIRVGYKNV
ncbi:MAG: single-stranded-DNA-specific exonuclease RecJ [Clostridia bacterium]|nr:single-stranded-DNA-specific exonuclease RecJ [Clostridia bacterium]